MKSLKGIGIVLSIVLIMLSSVQTKKLKPDYTYKDYCKEFNCPKEKEEYEKHKAIFEENYKKLLKIEEEGEEVEPNRFLDWDEEQRRNFFNFRPEEDLPPKPDD